MALIFELPPDVNETELACRVQDPEIFFPERENVLTVATAKRLCGRCAVQEVCLQSALERHEEFGVWGGTSGRERRKMFRNAA